MTRPFPLLALFLLVAGCASAPKIAAPHPKPSPPLLAPPAPVVLDWKDAPVEPGTWSYAREAGGTVARFGLPGSAAAFELHCDSAARQVSLSRPGTAAGTMTITTSYGARAWPAAVQAGRVAVTLPSRDAFLDQLAFSRARFAVEAPGLARLVLPAWAEPTRVVEDCRG